LERHDVAQVGHFAVEVPDVLVVLDDRLITLVSHRGHCSISASIKKRRTDFTVPLSVSFCGCGRWNTARRPFKPMRTRDPGLR
jgi:hypothetical protein